MQNEMPRHPQRLTIFISQLASSDTPAARRRDRQQVPHYCPNMMMTTTSCWKSVSLGLVGRRHRLTAARAQQRPPWAARFQRKSAGPHLCLHWSWAGSLVLASSPMLTRCHLRQHRVACTLFTPAPCFGATMLPRIKSATNVLFRQTKLNRLPSPKAGQAEANTGSKCVRLLHSEVENSSGPPRACVTCPMHWCRTTTAQSCRDDEGQAILVCSADVRHCRDGTTEINATFAVADFNARQLREGKAARWAPFISNPAVHVAAASPTRSPPITSVYETLKKTVLNTAARAHDKGVRFTPVAIDGRHGSG